MNHRLSIVLPVYNGERYLRQAIDSVLAQSYGDFDLLICNDASTDNSAEIIESYRDRRITVSHHRTNVGLFKTLNRAIAQTSGEWVRTAWKLRATFAEVTPESAWDSAHTMLLTRLER